MIRAIVPPEIPGMRSAVPMANPLRNKIDDFLEIEFFNNQNFEQDRAKIEFKDPHLSPREIIYISSGKR